MIDVPVSQSAPAAPSSRRRPARGAPSSRKPAPPPAAPRLDPLTALRVEYALALPARVRTLALALRAWRRVPGSASHLERARALSHRLRGTAGSYGFAGVGAAAGRIEDALARAAGEPGEAHTSAWGELWSALRDAETLAAQAVHEVPGRDGVR